MAQLMHVTVIIQAETNKRHPSFLPLPMRADLDDFLMDLKPNMANFFPTVGHFLVWQKKKSEFTTEISFCEFGNFFLPKISAKVATIASDNIIPT